MSTPTFTFDLSSLLSYASTIFTQLVPIMALIGGLALGAGLVKFVLREVRSLLGGGGGD